MGSEVLKYNLSSGDEVVQTVVGRKIFSEQLKEKYAWQSRSLVVFHLETLTSVANVPLLQL